MTKIVRDSRVLLKRSSTPGDAPVIGSGDDHTTWVGLPLNIYKGELFLNLVDDRLWVGTNTGIVEMTPSYYTSLSDTIVSRDGAGGIPSGTTVADLKGKSYKELFDDLLFPLEYSTYDPINSVNFSPDIVTTTVEVGTLYAPSVTADYIAGTIINGDLSTGPDLTGTPNQYVFKLPGESTGVTYVTTSSSRAHTFTGYNVLNGDNIWSVTVDYNVGSGTYYDNKGNSDTSLDGLRAASSITKTTSTKLGRYRYWYCFKTAAEDSTGAFPSNSATVRGISDTGLFTGTTTATFTMEVPANHKYITILIPSSRSFGSIIYTEGFSDDIIDNFFNVGTINVDDGSGSSQIQYTKWQSNVGAGYSVPVHYVVTVI